MLADLIAAAAATPVPAARTAHDAYDWWSDIWLPALVGFGSVGAAAAAVIIAWRSNKLAAAATDAAKQASKAAERSNELAHEALLHEREQARLAAEQAEVDRRSQFAQRVVDRFDSFLEMREFRSVATTREIAELGTLALEGLASDWKELDINGWVGWALRLDPADPDERRRFHRDVRQAIHTMMATWARNPAGLKVDVSFFEHSLNRDYPTPEA